MRYRVALLWMLWPLASAAAEPSGTVTPFAIGYIGLENDERHAEFSGYANIVLRPAIDPYDGAATALDEGRVIARALDMKPDIERVQASDARAMIDAIKRLHARGVNFFLVDAPVGDIAEVAQATRALEILLFNISAPDDTLRSKQCAPHLLHTIPSHAMLADALAQFAVTEGWRKALLLHGPEAEDKNRLDAFSRAAKRFGIGIADVREFVHGHNPQNRARNNIKLLTQGDYDFVYVADARLALGRFVPYQTRKPRPVAGDAGLKADGWHWAAERYGAPQLNQRFEKTAGRRMTSADWAAWAAVRLIFDAIRAEGSLQFNQLADAIRGDTMNFDTYKGAPGSFRAWDNQLRQPILLHTENAVIAYAPFEGFLHPTERLDTLGHEPGAGACEMREAS